MNKALTPLWDIPTRIFHWTLVACMPLAWWTAETQRYDFHAWLGYTVLVLVLGRVVWGFVGSYHARFVSFVRGPSAVLAYLKGKADGPVGHNPLGGWSVLLLLTILLLQALSGLFNSDDILFNGPFYYAASSEFRDAMGSLHDLAFNALAVLVLVHVIAVVYHQRKGEKLIQAMFKGATEERQGAETPVPLWRWLLVLLALAALLAWAIDQAPKPTVNWW